MKRARSRSTDTKAKELTLAALQKLLPGTTVYRKLTNSYGIVVEHNFGFALPEVWVEFGDSGIPYSTNPLELEVVDSLALHSDRWNPADFGDVPFKSEDSGQLTLEFDCDEPPDPDDFSCLQDFESAWEQWEQGEQGDKVTRREGVLETKVINEEFVINAISTEPTIAHPPGPGTELVQEQIIGVGGNDSISNELPCVETVQLATDSTTVSTASMSLAPSSSAPVLTVEPDLQLATDSTTVSTASMSLAPSSSAPVLTVEPDLQLATDSTTVSTASMSLAPSSSAPVLTVEPDLQLATDSTTVSTASMSLAPSSSAPVLTVEPDLQLATDSTTHSCLSRKKRKKGDGTGRIQLRTITKKNGKQYQQPWYDWQMHTGEKIIYKSAYIPKRLLKKIQSLESAKAPIIEILKILGKKL